MKGWAPLERGLLDRGHTTNTGHGEISIIISLIIIFLLQIKKMI